MLYPLAAQVADKLCAMFERHGAGESPSTRVRDLVDVVIIATTQPMDGVELTQAIVAEASRRSLTLPVKFELPAPSWRAAYPGIVASTPIQTEFPRVDQAITIASTFLDPILAASADIGR